MSAYAAAMWGGLAAASLLLGAGLALRWSLSERLTGAIMGFGSGALISSIAYELVPESKVVGRGLWVVFAFALGALVFFFADWAIDHSGGAERKSIEGGKGGGSGTAIFLGTLLDGVPESLILGMGLATGGAISVASDGGLRLERSGRRGGHALPRGRGPHSAARRRHVDGAHHRVGDRGGPGLRYRPVDPGGRRDVRQGIRRGSRSDDALRRHDAGGV